MDYEKEFPLDIVGNPIKVGDVVALASRVGNSAEMKLRKVGEISYAKGGYNKWNIKVINPKTNRGGWSNASNMVVLEGYGDELFY